MPCPIPVEPSFSRCSNVSNIVRSPRPLQFGRARSDFLDRLLLAVDLERRDHGIHGNNIVKRHRKRSAYPPVKWVELGLLGLKSGGP